MTTVLQRLTLRCRDIEEDERESHHGLLSLYPDEDDASSEVTKPAEDSDAVTEEHAKIIDLIVFAVRARVTNMMPGINFLKMT